MIDAEDDHQNTYERERREENIKIARAIVGAINSLFSRQRRIDDPCLKHCLFVDKLSCILDIAMSTLQSQIEDEWPEDLKFQILTLSKDINQDLENLMTWVRNPTFSPDEPFGRHLMKSTKFYEDADTNDK